jgi:DNA gyrase subunit B
MKTVEETRKKIKEAIQKQIDNGETIKCTPDHKFILRDGSYCEAQYLQGKSLMPLYRKINKWSKNKKGYEMIKDNSTGKWTFTHLEVQPKLNENTVIHHIDCDSLNNLPVNLIEMDEEEHVELHRNLGSFHLSSLVGWNDRHDVDYSASPL